MFISEHLFQEETTDDRFTTRKPKDLGSRYPIEYKANKNRFFLTGNDKKGIGQISKKDMSVFH